MDALRRPSILSFFAPLSFLSSSSSKAPQEECKEAVSIEAFFTPSTATAKTAAASSSFSAVDAAPAAPVYSSSLCQPRALRLDILTPPLSPRPALSSPSAQLATPRVQPFHFAFPGTPTLGYKVNTLAAPQPIDETDESLQVTVDAQPAAGRASGRLALETEEGQMDVKAALSCLLSSGLSTSRRFSYPPTAHAFATTLPSFPQHEATEESTAAAAASGPARALSPALMSPTAASSLFQALDRKRAFKPYRCPTFTSAAFHRVTFALSCAACCPPVAVSVWLVDAARCCLTPLAKKAAAGADKGRGEETAQAWQVGEEAAMICLTVSRQAAAQQAASVELMGSAFFTLRSLLEEKELKLRVARERLVDAADGGEAEEEEEAQDVWDLRVEVKHAETLHWHDEDDRQKLRRSAWESSALTAAISRRDGRKQRQIGNGSVTAGQP